MDSRDQSYGGGARIIWVGCKWSRSEESVRVVGAGTPDLSPNDRTQGIEGGGGYAGVPERIRITQVAVTLDLVLPRPGLPYPPR